MPSRTAPTMAEVAAALTRRFPDAVVTAGLGGRVLVDPATLAALLEAASPRTAERVEEFHRVYDRPWRDIPIDRLPDDEIELRMGLIREEVEELEDALRAGDLVEAFDALLDIDYVVTGTAGHLGVAAALADGMTEVQRSNLSKLGADGKPLYRADGKVLKGPDFTPPDLAPILEAHGWVRPEADSVAETIADVEADAA